MEPDETNRGESESKGQEQPAPVEEALSRLDHKLIREDPESARLILDSLRMEDRAELVTRFSGRARFDLIMLSQDAEALVKELPEPEFWITVKQSGDEDSLELLGMARPEQIQHIFDLEWWHHDRLDTLAVVYWLNLLSYAGPDVPVKWFQQADEELLVSAFGKFFRVYKTDPDNEGAEPWRDFQNLWSLDNVYYLHFYEPKTAPALERVLEQIRAEEDMRYYGLLEYIEGSLPLEAESEAFLFRTARLADYGFVPFEEAIEVYAPLSDAELSRLEKEAEESAAPPPGRGPVPEYPLALAEPPELFASALREIADRVRRETLAMETGGLVNRLLIADGMDLNRIESVKNVLHKAYLYIEMGLQRWSGGEPSRAARLLYSQNIINIFRAGFTEVLLLARRSNRLLEKGWMSRTDYTRELLGEDAAVIGGLALERPKQYQGTDSEGAPVYREFSSFEEVDKARQTLLLAEAVGSLLFESLGLTDQDIGFLKQYYTGHELSFSTVFITAVCRVLAGGELVFAPLSEKDARVALEIAMTREVPRKVHEDVRSDLLERVEKVLSDSEEAGEVWRAKAREFADFALSRLEQEAGRLRLSDIDPRFLQCMVVLPDSDADKQ